MEDRYPSSSVSPFSPGYPSVSPFSPSSSISNNPQNVKARTHRTIYREDLARSHKEQTKTNVEIALAHYNANTEGPKYELVESFGSCAFIMCGKWIHVCFLAKPIRSSSDEADVDADTSPKHFFGEVARPFGEDMYVSCCIVDPKSSGTRDGCGCCQPKSNMYHPKDGFEAGNYPYKDRSDPMPDHYYDKSVPEECRIRM